MFIDLASDLHCDTYPVGDGFINWTAVKAGHIDSRVLIIAGDSSNDIWTTQFVILDAVKSYETVIWLDGNHEHYGTRQSVAETMAVAQQEPHPRELYLSGQSRFFLDGVLFIGCNGWYDFKMSPPQYSSELQEEYWRHAINDARLIHFDMSPKELAQQHRDFIAKEVTDAQENPLVEKIVIVTHTVPHPKGLLVRPENPSWNLLNGSFGNSLMASIPALDVKKKIKLWCFGHSHMSFDFDDGHIRYVANPRGYPGETRWSGPVQIEI